MAGPEREAVGLHGIQLVTDGGNVIDEPKLLTREALGGGSRQYIQTGEWKQARSLPLVNSRLDLGGPHEICLVRGHGPVLSSKGHVVVGAADLVFGAVATLREVFIAANVTALAVGEIRSCPNQLGLLEKPTRSHNPYGTLCDWNQVRHASLQRQLAWPTCDAQPTKLTCGAGDHHQGRPLLMLTWFGGGGGV